MNWIVQGNALQIDWLSVCKPTGKKVEIKRDDLFPIEESQSEIDFENEGGETYICGNPPYLGSKWQSAEQKSDLESIFKSYTKSWKSLDYVSGWFMKASEYCKKTESSMALVSTNSICQGQQVPILWPLIFDNGCSIDFARLSFKWSNLAAHNAGVIVVIVGISKNSKRNKRIYSTSKDGNGVEKN